ncbi:EcsC family protein [Nocardioides sp. zg-DK7169]|uniref:EcsC family protein n=1 Tax=Nocardioides sp. zg-DK7169 TaxID=2736600 RepID=UPI00155463D7|nr:EcsC family protein [Nocardioides sp. zg-DK7169]NPC99114.1 EcsC family protein [Nocardioides sp. zg-DK7169]
MSLEKLTPYERDAWQHSIDVLYAPTRLKVIPAGIRTRVSDAASKFSDVVADVPAAEAMKDVAENVFEGTLALTFQPALRSTRPDAIVKRYAKRHPDVRTLKHVRELSLEDRDAMRPPKFRYAAASAGEGAATALAVTGAEVSRTVKGGTVAAVALGAVAVDSVASMAMMGRTIGAVATRYGYDVGIPEEELFAMGVLSLGMATSVGAKAHALAALSRLAQEMMRQATWKQLNEHLLVQAVAKAYQMLGLRLTHRKLAQTLPYVGIGINAALSAQMTEQTFRRAQAVYRLRVLSEIYDIHPEEWVEASPGDDAERRKGEEQVVDVLEVLEGQRAGHL